MKLSKKNLGTFLLLLCLGLIAGTLIWELIERIISMTGFTLNLTTDPIGFNVSVIEFYCRINPGSIGGAIAGVFFFRAI